ncbi:MAG: cobalamin biosynthesis protein CobW, partial [Rhodospirillales bacterium]|nr:cobalamin biosynthesis protein CobW [Rhodospirillales bacterium]
MKIPATVVTGFLGAGKTTLIRHLLETAGGRRIALVINEFGSLGVDRELLLGCEVAGCADGDVIELANGCICCTVADDFLPTIELLLDRPDPPEHIVIETSGLALPKPLLKAFAWPQVRTRLTVDGVLAVIDAPAVLAGTFASDPDAVGRQRAADVSLDHTGALQELYEDQLAAADMVILNKFDLIDDAGRESIRRDIADRLDAAVKVVPAVHAAIPADIALGVGAAAEDSLETRPSHHDAEPDHDHDDFHAFVVELGTVADPQALESCLRDIA